MRNSYGTLVESWKIKLVKKLTKKEGLLVNEADDFLQEIVPILMAFKFDAEKSNGATEETVVHAVIRRRLKFMIRCRARRQNHEARYQELNRFTEDQPAQGALEPSADRATAICMDVQATLRCLPPQKKAVCDALMDGQPVMRIADDLGLSRYDVEQMVREIGDLFRSRNLDSWVQN
jgi:RNA polymerase sigma factor (sigma-70 family)